MVWGVLACLFGCFIETVLHSPVWPHTVLELLIPLLLPCLQCWDYRSVPSTVPSPGSRSNQGSWGLRGGHKSVVSRGDGQLCTLEHRRVLLIGHIDFEFRKFQILDCWLLSTTGRHVAAWPCLVPEQLQPDMSGHCSVTRVPSSSQPA